MSDVPCNGCRTCCRDQFIVLMPEDDAYLSILQFDKVSSGDETFRILKNKPNGECAHLGENGCEVYDQRPVVCRTYDCRKQFLIMSRNERRQFKNGQIWVEARKRLGSLDADDRAGISTYRAKASAAGDWFKTATSWCAS